MRKPETITISSKDVRAHLIGQMKDLSDEMNRLQEQLDRLDGINFVVDVPASAHTRNKYLIRSGQKRVRHRKVKK